MDKKRSLIGTLALLVAVFSCFMLIVFAPSVAPYKQVRFEQVVWSPDGDQIAFQVGLGGTSDTFYDLYVIDADGENLKRIEDRVDSSAATWEPSGNGLAYLKDDSIYVYYFSSNKSRYHLVPRHRTSHLTNLAWSPADRYLAYWEVEYTLNRINTLMITTLSVDSGYLGDEIFQFEGVDRIDAPYWSTDESGLYFIHREHVYWIDTSGENLRPISPDDLPVDALIRVDEEHITFASGDSTYQVPIDEGEAERIGSYDETVFPSPDGQRSIKVGCDDSAITALPVCSLQNMMLMNGSDQVFSLNKEDFSLSPRYKIFFWLFAALSVAAPLVAAYLIPSRQFARIIFSLWLLYVVVGGLTLFLNILI